LFRIGTVWSLPVVYVILLLFTGVDSGGSRLQGWASLHGLVDLAGLASVCLIVPWLLSLSAFSRREHWLLILGVVGLIVLQELVPGTELSVYSQFTTHIFIFFYALCAGLIIWVIFWTSARGKRGLWWLWAIVIAAIFLSRILFYTAPGIWFLFTIPTALILLSFRRIRHNEPWKLLLIMVGSVVVFAALISGSAWRGDMLIPQSPQLGLATPALMVVNALNGARVFIATVAFLAALRIALHGLLGIYSPNIRVRTKLTLSVLFSSVIPGILVIMIGLLGVGVIAGGYCASLVKSMLTEQGKDLRVWLEALENPTSTALEGEPLGSGILKDASLDIYEVTGTSIDSVWLERKVSSGLPMIGDNVVLPRFFVDEGSGFVTKHGHLKQAAIRRQDNMMALVYRPVDQDLLREIKEPVGVDIQLFFPAFASRDTSEGIAVRRVGRVGGPSGFPIIITGEDTLRLARESVISTLGIPGRNWKETSIYFGMNYLDAIDLDHRGIEDRPFIMVVRTSFMSLYNIIFSQANTMNRTVFKVFLLLAAILLITLAIIWGSGIFVARRISASAGKLLKGTQRLRNGDLDVQIPLSSRDELGEVASSFNLMARDLKRMMADMAEKERIQQELAIARSIQLNLLPGDIPELPGIDVFGMSEPAREVGGDCFDFLPLNGGQTVLSIGDVSGKGMAAALVMANLQSSLRIIADRHLSPKTAIRRLNESICRNVSAGMFVTYFLGLWDNSRGELVYVNAGHDFPLVLRADGFEALEEGGLVLGVDPEARYSETSVSLEPGDWLFMYSDGIVDVRDAQGNEFDVDQLQQLLRKYMHLSAREVVLSVMEEVKQFSQDPSYEDDRTLVAFHVLEEGK
jgi:serine phosphatase RsbU (regulator of sigma subunit)